MLVLSRKVGERIVIDGGIEVVVLAVEGNRVRLGIEAPRDCPIVRGELLPASSPNVPPASILPTLVAPPSTAPGPPALQNSQKCLV
jgi:carbon storage regulator